VWLLLKGEMAGAFRTKRLPAHVWHTVVVTISTATTSVSVQNLPLPKAVTFQYSHPLFVAAFSALFIGDRVGAFGWGAVAFRLLGGLLISWPNRTMLSARIADMIRGEIIRIISAMIASAGGAVVLLLIGQLVQTEMPMIITHYFWPMSSILLPMTSITGHVP
jgi:drug/metabolite transporter (DMT)-like permease